MDCGTFSERAMDFSEGEIGSFGGFVLILFRASDGNRIGAAAAAVVQRTSRAAGDAAIRRLHSSRL